MSKLDLAWAAGFFDGEGCVYIDKYFDKRYNVYRYALRINVSQVDLKPLKKFLTLFKVGRICTFHNNTSRWVASGYDAIKVLKILKPYSVVKISQIKLALLYETLMTQNYGRKIIPVNVLELREKIFKMLRQEKINRSKDGKSLKGLRKVI